MRKLNVLFLCTGNSARSQMAEALLRRRAGDRFDVHSAGMEPKGIHPMTRRALEEIGLDIRAQRSKDVREYLGKLPVHYLIVVCDQADQTCPRAFPGVVHRLFWPFPDPAAFRGTEAEQLQKFREVRDEIDRHIQSWLSEIPSSAAASVGGAV